MALSGMDTASLAVDAQSLDKLKLQARQSPDQSLRIAAQQFETVFLNMMLKSMRDATPQDGVFDSEQTKMFTGMLDQQLAQTMANRGVGLAEVMVRQLSQQQVPSAESRTTSAEFGVPGTQHSALSTKGLPSAYRADFQQAFVDKMRPHAEAASRTTGIPAHLIMGQAALESGWGKREIMNADGSNSHNLFGIKAGKDWKGGVAEVTTTEYHNGIASKQVERFRAYGSYTEGFRDYAALLSDNPRYAAALDQTESRAFAQALQKAGYATDPRYADKLVSVIGSVRTRA
ncbi:MAG: flagellar assembly peptidoglycan hydrolase FlgJ [Gammaproteobacteria bacterium]|nr:flagellar assembly peptidoglycan hydrolase FlgJ [Gammaproteobacteria bacterium]MBU1776356.1 flagellar assembly peptidoglycan hydrolase FlgJ [Gammaproteobacteria bacterium]MBU1968208.1 flagellar assembly peptidoglycan hydrolase FlgJ [Gammaproteobacteria bacterium]